MTDRMSKRLTARLDQGDALFRYYDPRLLPVIHKEWSGSETHYFFDLGSTWHYLDSSFDLQALPLVPPGGSDSFAPPLRVSPSQHQALQSISELRQLVRLLGLRKPDAFYRIDPALRLDFVASQRLNAAGCGITKFIDLLHYCAMDHAEIGLLPHAQLRNLLERRPAINAALWRITLVDAAIFRQAVTNNGARDHVARLAHLMCEQHVRAKEAGLAQGRSCSFPVSQAQLAQALGVSHISVHRALQRLRSDRLITLGSGKLEILNWTKLARVAGFDATYLHLTKG